MNCLLKIKVKDILLLFSLGLLSIFFGLLAVTADPIMIGLGTGMILGPILLMKPELTIWLILVVGLLLGVLTGSPKFSKIAWIVSLLSMLLLAPSLLNMVWSKQQRAPSFILIALVFVVYSVGVSFIQCDSLLEFILGFKRYFQSLGLMMAFTLIAFTPQKFERWRKFLLTVALLQFPFALFELLVLVPLRGGVSLSSETTDVVAGTFGANLEGGSPNSVMVTYLFITLAFLVTRWRAGLLNSKVFYLLALICLLPLGMGETKIAVIMLPMAALVCIRKDLMSKPLKYMPSIFIFIFLTMLLGYVYVSIMMHSSLDEVVEATLRYNVGDQGYSKDMSLNRLTSITFWAEQQTWNDPFGFLFGNGLGSSYTAVGDMAGHLGLKYPNYGINLTAASTLLWDTGFIGLMIFVSIFVVAWSAADKLFRSVNDSAVKADALAIQAAISLFLLSLPYSDYIVNLISMEMIYSLVLGYLGYLMNHHGILDKALTSSGNQHG